MQRPGLATEVVDGSVYERALERFREQRIVMPTFAQLAEPLDLPDDIRADVAAADPDAPDPRNLFRVHWHNAADRRGTVEVPEHIVLGRELTGVDAPIVVALADRFPMIASHKVLAAYACLAPRIVTGQFDPSTQRAVWPSTGNYCRGGVAISRIMGCRGVAVLPEGMSRERFDWLEAWAAHPEDVIRTPGTESNVKEIYDRCAELDREPDTVIFNQFSEYPNHLVHYLATGRALERILRAVTDRSARTQPFAFVSASGSAGTLGAGDYLKERLGTRTVAVEALECPTMLENGFGEHNIQGIGDKHIPLIHNVMATDYVVAVSDTVTDRLNALFNTDAGRAELARRGVPDATLAALPSLGLSSICNIVAAIKVAKHAGLGPDDVLVTIATDGARMYASERDLTIRRAFGGTFGPTEAAATFGEALAGAASDHVLELTDADRRRIFNLGYYTWVEQQGIEIAEFTARRDQGWWHELRELLPAWDEMIREFNARSARVPVA
ncbi:MAG TPA: pyridoxal-phosphate dependent enzyme [Candidatus Limnocylindria bacterium]|nr:pyridoxal-phosphate dependent enzyme [Candidatus Limnocylindria bacterium]